MGTGERRLSRCVAVQHATGEAVQVAWANQGYTGQDTQDDAEAIGMALRVAKLPEANKSFALLPKRVGWWNAALASWRAFAAYRATLSACLMCWRRCTLWCLSPSYCPRPRCCLPREKVHNTL